MRTIQRKRNNVIKALFLEMFKSIAIGVTIALVGIGLCMFINPTTSLLPLLLQGEYLVVFCKLIQYSAMINILYLSSRYKTIKESISLLYQSRNM